MTSPLIPIRRRNDEELIQLEVAAMLDAAGIRWCHVPNEGKCSPREGARRKRRGVKAGIPDILIFDPPPAWAGRRVGAALELKTPRGRLTPEQGEWLQYLEARYWVTAIARGADDAREILRAWGYRV